MNSLSSTSNFDPSVPGRPAMDRSPAICARTRKRIESLVTPGRISPFKGAVIRWVTVERARGDQTEWRGLRRRGWRLTSLCVLVNDEHVHPPAFGDTIFADPEVLVVTVVESDLLRDKSGAVVGCKLLDRPTTGVRGSVSGCEKVGARQTDGQDGPCDLRTHPARTGQRQGLRGGK